MREKELSNKIRYGYIDVAKGIGIVLVVLGHALAYSGLTNTLLFAVIYSFHMPFFFFISGYLHNSKSPSDYYSGKVCTLIIPYLIFIGINQAIYVVLKCISLDKYYDYLKFGGTWFLLTLFMTSIIYYSLMQVINYYTESKTKSEIILFTVFFIILVIGLIYAGHISDQKNEPVATTFVALFFYELGFLYHNKTKTVEMVSIINRCVFGFVGVLLFVVVSMTVGYNSVTVDMNTSRYGITYIFLIDAILGSLALYCISYAIYHNKVIEYLGRNSLLILMLHIPLSRSMVIVCGHFDIFGKLACTITFIVSLTISLLFIQIINKYLPFLIGKIDWNRLYEKKCTK